MQLPTYCPDCESVCGSQFQGALCGCDDCPRCNQIAHLALAKWFGATKPTQYINPTGGATP